MFKKIFSFLFLSLALSSIGQNYPQDYFRSPLDIPLFLSGTFAELRSNHFHGGIDIKTQGAEGKNIYAAANGYISRIKVSPWGYGNALYIKHPNGYTTVYGHLQKYSDEIQAYIKTQQYKKKSFEVDLYLNSTTLPVKKGDVVALSGNSGGSGGPHLHFEIRNQNQEPINPLLFGFEVKDKRNPTIYGLYEYQLDSENPNRKELSRKYLEPTSLGSGEYSIESHGSSGSIAFGVHTIDRLDGADNKNGVFTITTYVNDTAVHQFKAEKFNFNESRYLNAHIDYGLSKSVNRTINRCYVLPGSRLKMYPIKGDSRIDIKEGKTYHLKWIVSDAYGNESSLKTTIIGKGDSIISSQDPNWVGYKEDFYLKTEEFGITIPKGNLYQDEIIKYSTNISDSKAFLSKIQTIGSKEIPLHGRVFARIKIPDSCKAPLDKLFVAYLKNGKTPVNEGGRLDKGWLSFKTKNLGSFTIMTDTIAPVIKPISIKKNYKSGNTIRFKVTDDLSGIDSYQAKIDGNWVLLSYDPKKAQFFHELDEHTNPGTHAFEIIIADERKNSATFTFDFTLQ